jgi:very-short-patch-repair endonuclease
VLEKVVPAGYFYGQFEIPLSSGNKWVDFAIETTEGKRIAVELEGYNYHTKDLTPQKFDEQLLQQNELVCAGWTVLRFSVDQLLMGNVDQCQNLLYSVMNYDSGGVNEIAEFNKTPVLKACCPTLGCDGEVQRLRDYTGDFSWKCQKCDKVYSYDLVTPEDLRLNR